MLFVAFDVSDFKHSFINHSKELAKTTITSVVLTKDTAIFLSKNVNVDLTMAHHHKRKPCENGVRFRSQSGLIP